jgi:hypothetical protein
MEAILKAINEALESAEYWKEEYRKRAEKAEGELVSIKMELEVLKEKYESMKGEEDVQ